MPWSKLQANGVDALMRSGPQPLDCLVMFALIGLAQTNGFIFASQREIAEYCKRDQSNISKAIKRLVRLGFVFNANGQLRIDPMLCRFDAY